MGHSSRKFSRGPHFDRPHMSATKQKNPIFSSGTGTGTCSAPSLPRRRDRRRPAAVPAPVDDPREHAISSDLVQSGVDAEPLQQPLHGVAEAEPAPPHHEHRCCTQPPRAAPPRALPPALVKAKREGEVLPMADKKSGPERAVVVAMKGHPGCGKSTAARAIAAALRCPLLDKDDVRDCTLPLEGPVASGTLNELSYAVLWRVVERQARLGLSVVVDSPLSRRAHLEALTRLPAALVVIVECRAVDEKEWRRRLEERGAAVVNGSDGGGGGWHKPKTWGELEKLLERYQGCTDYDIGDVPRIVVDTTDPAVHAEAIAAKVVGFVNSLLGRDH